MAHPQTNVLQSYEDLDKIVKKYYSSEDPYIISCPSQDQVHIVYSVLYWDLMSLGGGRMWKRSV